MKIYSIQILYKDHPSGKTIILQACHDLNQFSYFQRGSVKEFLEFTSKLVVERTDRCQRSSVKEQDYLCHIYIRNDQLSGVLFSDEEYPNRVAQTVLTKLLDEFSTEYPAQRCQMMEENSANFKRVGEFLQKYQNPKEADPLMRLQNDLDETKIVLHQTLEQILVRGEKIDDLVQRSEGLSAQSKMFYQTAKKTNRCCTIL